MTINKLKIIGCVTMLMDHVGKVFFPDALILQIIGRVAFPLFAFALANGYFYTKNKLKYSLLLLGAAIISQPIYCALFDNGSLNVLFLFSLGIGLLYLCETALAHTHMKIIPLIPVIFVGCFMAELLNLEYGCYGILMILCFWYFRENKKALILSQIAVLAIYSWVIGSLNWFIIQSFSLLSLIPISSYHGLRGRKSKYFFYVFYPLHLLVILIISIILKI